MTEQQQLLNVPVSKYDRIGDQASIYEFGGGCNSIHNKVIKVYSINELINGSYFSNNTKVKGYT